MPDIETTDHRRWFVSIVRTTLDEGWPDVQLFGKPSRTVKPDKIMAVYEPGDTSPVSLHVTGVGITSSLQGRARRNIPCSLTNPPAWVAVLLAQAPRPPWERGRDDDPADAVYDK